MQAEPACIARRVCCARQTDAICFERPTCLPRRRHKREEPMRVKIALLNAIAVAAAVWPFTQVHAGEAPYPSRNVTIVVPFSAGGSADILNRAVAKGLTEIWGRSVVVEHRPGAASMLGAEYVANS